jgi:hypothetical protein
VERPENVIQATPPTPTPDDLDETVPIIALSNSVEVGPTHDGLVEPDSNWSLRMRVTRLEEQMDSILDRLAHHNVSSAWKI